MHLDYRYTIYRVLCCWLFFEWKHEAHIALSFNTVLLLVLFSPLAAIYQIIEPFLTERRFRYSKTLKSQYVFKCVSPSAEKLYNIQASRSSWAI